MKKIKPINPPPVSFFNFKLILVASLISCLTLSAYKANADDISVKEQILNPEEDIEENFIDIEQTNNAGGGVISNKENSQEIGIKGNFEKNRNKRVTSDAYTYGGAIYNKKSKLKYIQGDFEKNYNYAIDDKFKADNRGGAVANTEKGKIGDITGNFTGNHNHAESAGDYSYNRGGAIYNYSKAEIGNITGNFIENYNYTINTNETGAAEAYAGALHNDTNSKIQDIKGNFTQNYNYVSSKNGTAKAHGGAINNYEKSKIENITGDFTGNYNHAESEGGDIENWGGAIYNKNSSTIKDINGNFKDNYNRAESESGNIKSYGGAINNYNNSEIGDITGDFIGNYNYAESLSGTAESHGGAIYNDINSKIGNIKGNFIKNYSYGTTVAHGGVIDNYDSTIGNITGDFIENYAKGSGNVYGGAIYNYKRGSETKIGNITGDFTGNYAVSDKGNAFGGVIYNQEAEIGNIEGNFYSNSAESTSGQGQGGALANTGKIGNIHGNFVSNSASQNGGALYNAGSIGNADDNKGIYNSSFYNNSAGEHGGAIYTDTSLTLTANGAVSEFANNKANGESEAIYVGKTDDDVILSLYAENGGKFNFFDTINGEKGYNLAIKGDESGEVNLYNNILNADITHENLTTNVFDAKYLNNSNSLDMKSGTININNFGLTQLNFRNFGIQGGTINIDSVDVNLAEKIMGKITANDYAETNDGVINVNGMRVFADSSELVTPVNFADASFANTVQSSVHKAYGPIYQYSVDYLSGAGTKTSTVGSTGDFLFTRLGFNPAILASSVAQLTGGYASMVQTYNYAFEHADTFSALPASVRKAMLNQNKYAITEGNLPLYNNHLNKNALWFRPYTSFESIPLKNGPKTSTVLYGSYIGGDSEIFHLKNGWDSVYTGYIGYIGASQAYQGNHTYQNGIVGGVTDTFYKNNFYTAITASVGSSIGETSTMYGNEDFTMLMGGVASKTGYNFEFNNGRFIIQPNLLLSYTFINTFDYTNAAKVRINAEPLHALQVHPYVKFIQNTESGWQPYLAGGFVYNVMGQSQIRVADLYGNNVQLPALSIKPYAEYGLGVQKLWNDKYTGFLQAMVRNGGRNGIAFTMGFRIALGDDGKKVEKVKADDKNIKPVSNKTKTKKPAKVKSEKPAKVETKVPEKVQTNEIILRTEVIQPAVKTEVPAKVENPAKIKTETLAKTQQPEKEEHHSFIYNWMLKFSNFFCQPLTPKVK